MRVVILAAGDFPKAGSEGERLLRAAGCVVACDSASETYRAWTGFWPDVVVGDFDSSLTKGRRTLCRLVKNRDPNKNDLQKALDWCFEFLGGPDEHDYVILGATGKREDHTIGNIFRALENSVKIVTDEGTFYPFGPHRPLVVKTWKDLGASVFVSSPTARLTSKGLKWKLDGVSILRPYDATLNRTSRETVKLTSTHRAYLYLAHHPKAVRAVVALGSNLGNRESYLRRALKKLSALPETRLIEASFVHETRGVDVPEEFKNLKFLNQVALFETTLEPFDFSRRMHAIEDELGRVRTVRNGPRTIDLDLISFGDVHLETEELTLPHPRAAERVFVFEPMRELGLMGAE